ncbi:MAG: dTDP-4-dehydrorhamnose 3,5-epimerase [Pseudomonadota bacterium]
MQLTPTPILGAFIAEQKAFGDHRGYFARAYCKDVFAGAGLDYEFVQANMSGNAKAGTLRGLHYQDETAPEAKFLRCVRGAIYDVIVDLRPSSPSFRQWFGVELTQNNKTAILVPPMCAHGYLSLTDDTEVFYQVSNTYTPSAERGMRFDDPSIVIDWPVDIVEVSDKDKNWPDLTTQGIV